MSQKVKIKIKNVQKMNNGKKDLIENIVKGIFYIKKDIYYLVYQDYSEGMDGAETIIKVDPAADKIFIIRGKPARMRQTFTRNSINKGKYHTRYGKFDIKNRTNFMEYKMGKKQGRIELAYDLFLNQKKHASNKLIITYYSPD
ncbi:MAG: DUF1934 domain-containing protein [Halanaerobiaceae bacterium]